MVWLTGIQKKKKEQDVAQPFSGLLVALKLQATLGFSNCQDCYYFCINYEKKTKNKQENTINQK